MKPHLCVSLLQRSTSQYFSNIDQKKVTYKKSFCIMVNHFSDKGVSKGKTIIAENEKIIDKDRETAEVFNAFFFNIVGNLDIAE